VRDNAENSAPVLGHPVSAGKGGPFWVGHSWDLADTRPADLAPIASPVTVRAVLGGVGGAGKGSSMLSTCCNQELLLGDIASTSMPTRSGALSTDHSPVVPTLTFTSNCKYSSGAHILLGSSYSYKRDNASGRTFSSEATYFTVKLNSDNFSNHCA